MGATYIKGKFKLVYIPADPQEPIEEKELTYSEETEVSCVQDYAKAHFRQHKPKKTEAQARAQREQFLQQVPEEQRHSVTDDLIDQATSMNLVEHVALLSNAKDNGFLGVTMYCDDEAGIVNAPVNIRASEIASCAGKPSEVRGDVFMARVFDNEDDFKRLDFSLQEISSTAAWVKEAYAQNERKRKADTAQVAFNRIQSQASNRVTELAPAEAEKESGNEAFKRGDYHAALKHYSKAIELGYHHAVAYNNRAMTRLKLKDYIGAEVDCDHVLMLDSINVKALLRRASAREALNRKEEALHDYRQVAELEPNNKVAAAKIQELQVEPASYGEDVASMGVVDQEAK